MRIWALVLVVLAFVFAAPGGAVAKTKPCRPAESLRTTIEAIQANVVGWQGRCVVVRGIRMRERLYSSREATLDPRDIYGESTPHSLVVYPDGRRRAEEPPRWIDITGRVGSCAWENAVVADMQARSPNEIIMVAGYCHTSLAPYVRPTTIADAGDGPIRRFTEAETPLDRRPLIELPGGMEAPQAHLLAARGLVTAIATRDEAEFLRLTQPDIRDDYDKLHGSRPPDWLRDRIAEVRSKLNDPRIAARFGPLAPLAGREEKVFIERSELPSAGEVFSEKEARLVVCWCGSAHCAGRWPVTLDDADNDASRPYACVRTNGYFIGLTQEWAVQATAETYPRGLSEPTWPQSEAPSSETRPSRPPERPGAQDP
jgi:hypothetical protein